MFVAGGSVTIKAIATENRSRLCYSNVKLSARCRSDHEALHVNDSREGLDAGHVM